MKYKVPTKDCYSKLNNSIAFLISFPQFLMLSFSFQKPNTYPSLATSGYWVIENVSYDPFVKYIHIKFNYILL